MAEQTQITAGAPDETVSFAELVWAHFKRQEEVFSNKRGGEWEQEYRRRLALFKKEHGEIVDVYWCRYEASGIALTELGPGRIQRLHTATDWRTARHPAVATALYECQTLANKVSEVLRHPAERIALHWLFTATARLLAFVDRKKQTAISRRLSANDTKRLLSSHREELRQIEKYYERAGENSARIVYFGGMIRGALLLAVAGVLAWALGLVESQATDYRVAFTTLVMGAAGAMLSVTTRMSSGGFNLDFEVGRKSVRLLGTLRPFIGAAFAFVLYLAIEGGLVQLGIDKEPSLAFYATISFLAGFSERRAKVLLDSAASAAGWGAADEQPRRLSRAPA